MDQLEQIFHHCENFKQFELFEEYLETLKKYYLLRKSLKIQETFFLHAHNVNPQYDLDTQIQEMLINRKNSATKKALEAEIALVLTKLDELTVLLKASFNKNYC